MKPEIIIIAAVAENRVIGRDNAIPWSLKEDMQHFRSLTMGCPCIMGRRTWESLPRKPLPGRLNIVLSSRSGTGAAGEKVCPSLPAALALCASAGRVFIIGGASVYREAMALASGIELTLVRGEYEGDVFFPAIDPRVWERFSSEDHEGFSFITYKKILYNPGNN
jgi:dihydrofolate reductase